MTSPMRPCARVPFRVPSHVSILGSAAILATVLSTVASAEVTLLDFTWSSSANTTQSVQATCDDACPGGFPVCTATVPSFSAMGSSMNPVNTSYVAGKSCSNSCGDALHASATSGVSTDIAVKAPLVAGQTKLWSFAHSIASIAEATVRTDGCGEANASASTSAHHAWNLAFRLDAPTQLTMNYTHSALREGDGVGAFSDWTLHNAQGDAIFEQHLGGPFGLPSEQGTVVWTLQPGDYTMQIDSSVDGVAVTNAQVASHSAAASCELVFRPVECPVIAAQSEDQTIAPNDDLTLSVQIDPLMLGRHYQWQLQSRIPPNSWTDITDGVFYLAGGDRVVPLGQASGANSDTLFIDLDPQYANSLSGSSFRCVINDECGVLLSRSIGVAVSSGGAACPPCPADFDQDGGVTPADLSTFLAELETGAPCADVDLDGGITGADMAWFFAAYERGGC